MIFFLYKGKYIKKERKKTENRKQKPPKKKGGRRTGRKATKNRATTTKNSIRGGGIYRRSQKIAEGAELRATKWLGNLLQGVAEIIKEMGRDLIEGKKMIFKNCYIPGFPEYI